jgi:hypothetical protein
MLLLQLDPEIPPSPPPQVGRRLARAVTGMPQATGLHAPDLLCDPIPDLWDRSPELRPDDTCLWSANAARRHGYAPIPRQRAAFNVCGKAHSVFTLLRHIKRNPIVVGFSRGMTNFLRALITHHAPSLPSHQASLFSGMPRIAACAAARRATGTRKGEHET